MNRSLTRRSLLGSLSAALALPAMPAAARNLERLRNAGTLRVAVYQDFEPWAWTRDGKLTGIDVDLGKAFADRLGLAVDYFDLLAGEDVEEDLRNAVWRGPIVGNAADVMMHVPYDRAFALRNDRVVIVAPYYREGFAMACGRDTDCEVPPPQFKGKRVVAELDSIPDFYLTGAFGGVMRADVTHVPSGMAALKAVRDGRSDVTMATHAQIEHALVESGDGIVPRKGPIPALSSPGWDIGLAVKDDSRDLGDRLDSIVAEMKADGAIEAIFKRHGVTMRAPIAS